MRPFDVLVPQVSDADLGPLLTRLTSDGFQPRILNDQSAPAPATADRVDELPGEWRLVRELEGQSYSWPREREEYTRYRIFAADTREGTVHVAIGEAGRAKAWGRDRTYLITFLTSGAPQIPLVEFLEVDDYPDTHELIAIIRGSDGGKKMYGPGDSLPEVYTEHFRIEVCRDRIKYPRSWNKLAVIAHENDTTTILNHALLQARRRGDV